jgi:uncharacterized protein
VTILVDSFALYAVMDAADAFYESAADEWRRLLGGSASLGTTNYVLVETLALLQNRIGMEAVRRLTADILPILDVAWVDEMTHLAAHHAQLVSSQRELSLVDCVSFEVMRRFGIEQVFCFDPHFSEQGFRVLPAPAR